MSSMICPLTLERAWPAFPPQVSRLRFLQFVINERNHRVQGLLIAGVDTLRQLRDLHGGLPYYSRADGGLEDLSSI